MKDTTNFSVGQASSDSQRAEASPFNEALLLSNCMNKPDLAKLVLEKFEIQARDDLKRMPALVAPERMHDLALAAHALKGAAGCVTANSVERAAERVEHAARADAVEEAATAMRELHAEVERVLARIPAAREVLSAVRAGSPLR